MITFVLEASKIPDGTTVRKVTGQNTYTLQRVIKVYMQGDDQNKVRPMPIMTEGVVFLMGEGSINGYADTTKFAVDVPDDEARDFLDSVLGDDDHG